MATRKVAHIKWIDAESIFDRRIRIYYLIPPDGLKGHLRDLIEVRPEPRFFEELSRHVKALVDEGKAPPEAIASAILNVADDVLAGRDVELKTGDYIALQGFFRKAAA